MSSELSETSTTAYLQDAVLASEDVGGFLDELCRHAVHALSDGEEVLCGITVLRDKKAATVASSSEHARKMDEVQYNFDDGPCLTASREQITVLVPDLDRERRWPDYIAAITGLGMRSVIAVPFNLEGEAKAALNLYSSLAGEFSDETVDRAAAYAGEASASLRMALRIARHSETTEHLKAAMETRTVIDIAVGIIMCQSRCTQDDAFDILRKASSHRNIKLRELAGQIVEGNGTTTKPRTHFDD